MDTHQGRRPYNIETMSMHESKPNMQVKNVNNQLTRYGTYSIRESVAKADENSRRIAR